MQVFIFFHVKLKHSVAHLEYVTYRLSTNLILPSSVCFLVIILSYEMALNMTLKMISFCLVKCGQADRTTEDVRCRRVMTKTFHVDT